MAPFNTHFFIAEQLWPEINGAWQPYYGEFCFGCIAPDVDKISDSLTQTDTHFFSRRHLPERMSTHRSAAFIQQQDDFLGRPFAQLSPPEQAFAAGYLCHLCVDEVSKQMWTHDTWLHFNDTGPEPAFAALDEAARRQITDYPAILAGLACAHVPEIIPRIRRADLQAMFELTHRFAAATSTRAEFEVLLTMAGHLSAAEKENHRREFPARLQLARKRYHFFNLAALTAAGVARTRQRLTELLTGVAAQPYSPVLSAITLKDGGTQCSRHPHKMG